MIDPKIAQTNISVSLCHVCIISDLVLNPLITHLPHNVYSIIGAVLLILTYSDDTA